MKIPKNKYTLFTALLLCTVACDKETIYPEHSGTATPANVFSLTLAPLKASYPGGTRAASSLTLTPESDPGNVYTISYRIGEGFGTLLFDGMEITPGEQVPYLTGGQKTRTSSLTFDPASEGGVLVAITATDLYGRQRTEVLHTVYQSKREAAAAIPTPR